VATRSRLSAPLLALLLAGCWAGKPFYSREDLRAPIPPGVYRTIKTDSPRDQDRYRIIVRPDGYTALARLDGGEKEVAGFAPLPGRDGLFVAWFEESPGKQQDDASVTYGLLERRGPEFRVSFPMCSETRSIAEAVGGVFQPDPKVPMCGFPDRASLEAGLRRVAVEGPMESLRLVPIGKGGHD
jgi:hypothetical protein